MYATVEFSMLRCQKPGLNKTKQNKLIKMQCKSKQSTQLAKVFAVSKFQTSKISSQIQNDHTHQHRVEGGCPKPSFRPSGR